MLNDCNLFLKQLEIEAPSTIKNYHRFKMEIFKQLESNIYRDPLCWKYSLMEISYIVQKYLKDNQDEKSKHLCNEFRVLVQKAK